MISVVVATYNGEKFITEQLESIRSQTRKVDEVLICDDCSSDNTREICQNFIEAYELREWKVIENPYNLGYYQNFMNGLKLLHGDILVLCDQDDIWHPEKIQVIEKTMKNNPNILSLTTTFSRFDIEGNVLNTHVHHPHCIPDHLVEVSWKDFFTFHTYLGMSMAVRKQLIDDVMTDNPNDISHDIVLNMYAVKRNGLYHLDKVLTRRRSYAASTSNDRIDREINEKYMGNAQLQYISKKIELLDPEQFGFDPDDFTRMMLEFRKNYKTRYEYISKRNVLAWIKNVVHIGMYENCKQYFKDLLAIVK